MDKLDAEFNFGKQALDLRAYRQQLLSENVANADTPGYKSRDVNFASALNQALGSRAGSLPGAVYSNAGITRSGYVTGAPLGMTPSSDAAWMSGSGSAGGSAAGSSDAGGGAGMTLPMATTSAGQMVGVSGAAAAASAAYGTPKYRVPYQAAMDGNTVELDSERVNFADNAMHYETGLTVVNQQIKTMLSAVTGGNS